MPSFAGLAATLAPTIALIGLAATTPACCCGGGTPPPSPGPPGTISGHIHFPFGTDPAPITVYAVDRDTSREFTEAYLLTRVTPPASTYVITVPPGDYVVAARLDSDPMSAAGYITCRTSACNPYLTWVRVDASQALIKVDITGWGSKYAASELWQMDLFGSLMSVPTGAPASDLASPSPSHLPTRPLPDWPAGVLPSEHDLAQSTGLPGVRLRLPAGWYNVQDPAASVRDLYVHAFANEDVRSPLRLDSNGVFLSVEGFYGGCPSIDVSTATARLGLFLTPQGQATFYFRDPTGDVSGQPFRGFEFFGWKQQSNGCTFFKFTGASLEARESNLPTFAEIVFQSDYVDHLP